MFQSKTVFVVGAGASSEVGLPLGGELRQQIASEVDIKFRHGVEQISGSDRILGALRHWIRTQGVGEDINDYLHAGWHIAGAMPQAISIDNFIDNHFGNNKIQLCGKLAILSSILTAERHSELHFDVSAEARREVLKRAEGTWYAKLFRLMHERVRLDEIDDIFEKISFVIFNYDRCIEHYLYHGLQNYYGVDAARAAEILSNAKIYHPYGNVGDLPLEGIDTDSPIPFGANVSGQKLLDLVPRIKTFTEQQDGDGLGDLRQDIFETDRVIFLGFSYIDQNLELVCVPRDTKTLEVMGTSLGISESDREIIDQNIRTGYSKVRNVRIQDGVECRQFFDIHPKTLTS